MTSWADTPDKWARVAAAMWASGVVGLDTETYGHDVRSESAPHRAKIHVWSVAVGGYEDVASCVLPQAALQAPEIRAVLEDPEVVKVAHNAPHDVHAIANHGVTVGGWVDSLGKARLVWPDEPSHGLKWLCRKVGMVLRKYEEVLAVPNWVTMTRKKRLCSCGDDPCRKRGAAHARFDHEYADLVLRGTKVTPLESVVPGHAKWPELLEYAAEDAVAALKLWLLMGRGGAMPPPSVPWYVDLACEINDENCST